MVSAALLVTLVAGCGAPSQSVSASTALANNSGRTATASSQSSQTVKVGRKAPDFTLTDINGKRSVSLGQLLAKGKPILMNAWASWCPPCNKETPDLVKMAHKYGKQIQFVGLNLTTVDTVAQAKAFVSHYSIPYPVLLDPKGVFRDEYAVIAVPTTFLISPQGKVLAIHVGPMSATQMEQLIQSALQP